MTQTFLGDPPHFLRYPYDAEMGGCDTQTFLGECTLRIRCVTRMTQEMGGVTRSF